MITARYLLQGTIYALEQSGLLLSDAVKLYNAGSYATAVALAALSREELGRAMILDELRSEVLDGGNVTLAEIKNECEDHVVKQDMAQFGIDVSGYPEDGIGKLLKIRLESDPQSCEFRRAGEELDVVMKLKRKRAPRDRHEKRMNALYVEPKNSGDGWNRPKLTTKQDAKEFLYDAANAYAYAYDKFQSGPIANINPALFQALRELTDRPALPPPEYPKGPSSSS